MRQLGRLKKFFAGVLAAAMVFTTGVGVMAAETTADTTGKGSITIDKPIDGMTYDIYRVFDFEGSAKAADDTYTNGVYKLSKKWADAGFTSEYFDVNETDNTLTFKGDFALKGDTEAEKAKKEAAAKKFAAAALAYAKDASHKIEADASEKNITGAVEFKGLALGYYLVDSSAGAALSLDTTTTHATITEKNEVPTIDKKVYDEEKKEWKESNDAEIGEVVSFRVIIHAKKGAENYVLHDNMSKGLTFKGIDKIEIREPQLKDGSLGKFITEMDLTKALTPETFMAPAGDGHTFDLNASQACLDLLDDAKDIVVYYSATVNEKAAISPSTDANTNTAKLTYGDENETEEITTKTYVYKFDLHKYAKGAEDKYLVGAKFTLLSSNGVSVNLIKDGENKYRVAKAEEKSSATTEIITNDKGLISIEGLDLGDYYLVETEAPSGYNKIDNKITITTPSGEIELSSVVKVSITRENESADATGTYHVYADGTDCTNYEVKVLNNTGSLLPSTGGIGTTIFYLVGGLLIIGAFVSFIVRRKMAD